MKIFGKQGTTALPTAAFVALALAASGAQAQTAEVLTLDIESQQAGSALMELASSSGAQIMVSEQAGAEVEVESLQGEFRLEEALAAMLTDTGLKYEFTSENVVLVQQDMQAEQLEEVDAAEDTAPEQEEKPLELDPQKVTGTRLLGGDPSARVLSFSSEDIARRGVSSLEEFFRKMPWSQSSLNSHTSNSQVLYTNDGRTGGVLIGNGVGVAAINLQGMGWENTLVLMNGRRMAGTGGQEDDFVNLLNVPLAAIERIDVQLDGASAVYGSDALGGVVNFITKKNYRGLSATLRQESSSSGADKRNASITAGYAWGSGNVTAILNRTSEDPVINEKIGWTTLDYRPLFGPEFDFRNFTTGQPGVVCKLISRQWSPLYPPSYQCPNTGWPDFLTPYYQLPASHSGAGATEDDFVQWNGRFSVPSPVPLDEIPPHNGQDRTGDGVTITVEQYLTDKLRIFADLKWNISESYQEYDRNISGNMFLVPASNAYNPFGVPVGVRYAPIYESDTGLLPVQYDYSESESRTIVVGALWEFGDGYQLEVDANRTKSWRETAGYRANASRGALDPTAPAFYERLSSPDPAVAINVFGNGTAQGVAFDEFVTGGGEIPYTGVNEPVDWLIGSQFTVGVERPTRDTSAWFGEMAMPLIGPDNDVPAVHSLFLTLQYRLDTYETQGVSDGLTNTPVPVRYWYWDPFAGQLSFTERSWSTRSLNPSAVHTAKITDRTPTVGIQYMPTPNVIWRARWSRAFKAPNWSDQFSGREPYPPSSYGSGFGRRVLDPFDPDGPTEIIRALGVTQVQLNYTPDIEAEYTDNRTINVEWKPEALPGLTWTLAWREVEYYNRIANSSRWIYGEDAQYLLGNDKVAVRNDRGDLVSVVLRRINITADYIETLSTSIEYAFDTSWGLFTPQVTYYRYLDDFRQLSPEAPRESNLGEIGGPDKYKITASLSWQRGPWIADVHAYYTPSYVDPEFLYCQSRHLELEGTRCTTPFEYVSQGISSLTTVDLSLTYRMENGIKFRAGGTNILDRDPPPALSYSSSLRVPYDPQRWSARGQVFFLEVNWEFGADD